MRKFIYIHIAVNEKRKNTPSCITIRIKTNTRVVIKHKVHRRKSRWPSQQKNMLHTHRTKHSNILNIIIHTWIHNKYTFRKVFCSPRVAPNPATLPSRATTKIGQYCAILNHKHLNIHSHTHTYTSIQATAQGDVGFVYKFACATNPKTSDFWVSWCLRCCLFWFAYGWWVSSDVHMKCRCSNSIGELGGWQFQGISVLNVY